MGPIFGQDAFAECWQVDSSGNIRQIDMLSHTLNLQVFRVAGEPVIRSGFDFMPPRRPTAMVTGAAALGRRQYQKESAVVAT
jgi:hypothetical protein